MSSPIATFVSYRLGGTDGVSVEATKWEWALRELGFSVRRVAGEFEGLRPDDVWLPFLAVEPVGGVVPEPDALAAALSGTELVVVENLCSLPLNLAAARTTSTVLGTHQGRVLFHHHDLPWERPQLAHLDGYPPHRADSLHVTINDNARRALEDRGYSAFTIRNAFEIGAPAGARDETRRALGLEPADLLLVQPTRAIPRKNVGGGIAFAEQIAALVPERNVHYWITGPAEDGYESELRRLVSNARIPVIQGRFDRSEDAYAASDLVVMPSSWEGFGNAVIEGILAERPVVTGEYPALDELIALGLCVLPLDDPPRVVAELEQPDLRAREQSLAVIRAELSLDDLPRRIDSVFSAIGWTTW